MNNENSEIDIQPSESDSVTQESELDKTQKCDDSIESLQEKLASAEKQALLHQADLENFRRRKSKEMMDGIRYASLPLIDSLLQVHDNLERALQSAANDQNAASLREGVELVSGQLISALENHGCKRIESVGQIFDPNRHEAIQMQPDDKPLNTIIMEVQSGFTLHDRVVRPAKVIISTGPAKQK